MNETTLTKFLKRIILFLLIILSIFIIFKIYNYVLIFIKYIFKIILPFLISFSIAYILNPIVLFLKKLIKSRIIAVVITFLIFSLSLFLIIYFSIPLLFKEINHLLDNYEAIINSIEDTLNNFAMKFSFLPKNYLPTFDNIENLIFSFINKIDLNLMINKLFDYLGIIVIIPMTTIYFMIDYDRIIKKIKVYLDFKKYNRLKEYLSELNKNIKVFVRTTFLIMIIMFLLSSSILFFAKSDYPLFFGMIIAITNVIPYLGPYIGGAFPVLYALSVSPTRALIMLIIVVVVQIIESNIITPYLQGKKNDLHPILVIFGLLVFGKLFGIIGMIVSVPLLMVIKITYQYYPIKLKRVN